MNNGQVGSGLRVRLALLVFGVVAAPALRAEAPGTIVTLAGGGIGDGGPASQAIVDVGGVAMDSAGNLYINGGSRIRKVTPDGIIRTIAGAGPENYGFSGDGGPAVSARVSSPGGIALDRAGNLFFADTFNHRIRRIALDETISTVAGSGPTAYDDPESPASTGTYAGDGGPATEARLNLPEDVAVDDAGDLFIADTGNRRIRKVDPLGILTTVAGTGEDAGIVTDGEPATQAQVTPHRIAVDGPGNLYFSEAGRAYRVGADGAIRSLPVDIPSGTSADDLAAEQALTAGFVASVDARGGLYVAVESWGRVYRLGPDGALTRVAGAVGGPLPNMGDGGPAIEARLYGAEDVAVSPSGDVFIADDRAARVRRVGADGVISTVVGGDGDQNGVAATSTAVGPLSSMAADLLGNVYFIEGPRIRRLGADGTLSYVTGDGNAPAPAQTFAGPLTYQPQSLAVDQAGSLFIVDDQQVRKIDPTGRVTTVAGGGSPQNGLGDGGPATKAWLFNLQGVAVDGAGNLYFGDGGNRRVRKVAPDGIISTLMARRIEDPSDPLTPLSIDAPSEMVFDRQGDLFLREGAVLEEVDANGSLSLLSGVGHEPPIDGAVARDTSLAVNGLAVDRAGDLLVSSAGSPTIRKLLRAADGSFILSTIAGNGSPGFSGDGGPALEARLDGPAGLAIGPGGDLFIADAGNDRIRKVAGVAAGPDGVRPPPLAPPLPLSVSPPALSIQIGGQEAGFAVDPSIAVAWSVDGGAEFGTIDKDGYYLSPPGLPSSPTLTVRATSIGDPRRTAAARVTLVVPVGPIGIITTVSGGGPFDGASYTGDGGPALSAVLPYPKGMVLDNEGNLLVASLERIRKISADGAIGTAAGGGLASLYAGGADHGDGGPATAASLYLPSGMARNAAGELFVADEADGRVRRIGLDGTITTVAGSGPTRPTEGHFSGDGGPADHATLYGPSGVAVDSTGSLYIADTRNHRVRKVDRNGIIATIAGIGPQVIGGTVDINGFGGFSGDGAPATMATLNAPTDLVVDGNGGVIFSDTGNHRIRRIGPDGTIATIAGNGRTLRNPYLNGSDGDFSGDGGPAALASLNSPRGLALDASGSLYIADTDNHRVRKVDPEGIITTVAGIGPVGSTLTVGPFGGYFGDGGPATAAALNAPRSVMVDGAGNLYIGDTNGNRVRKVDPQGIITTVAGVGAASFTGDGGPASEASLSFPGKVAVGPDEGIYISDWATNHIRKIGPDGIIQTIAGAGTIGIDIGRDDYIGGYFGDGGPAIQAVLNEPQGMALTPEGDLYFADTNNAVIRKVTPAGIITTVAGGGPLTTRDPMAQIALGDGGPALSASLMPDDVALDAMGNLYISDTGHHRVRRVALDGTITTVAGGGVLDEHGLPVAGFYGDGGPATKATLWGPEGLAIDRAGNLYIADVGNNRIRMVDGRGIISTVAGIGPSDDGIYQRGGFNGDGGPAVLAQLRTPTCLAIDSQDNLFIGDYGNGRVRKVGTDGVIWTVAGGGVVDGEGIPATAAPGGAAGVAIDSRGDLLFTVGNRLRRVSRTAAAGLLGARPFAHVRIVGDLNGDGKVDIRDATVSLRIAIGSWPQIPQDDVNADGKENLLDTTLILRTAITGLSP